MTKEGDTKEAIRRGAIFHSTIFETIDHGKFFVIIGENEVGYIGFFYINSQIHRYILGKQKLLDLQFYVKREHYPFLKYDSFLNCASLEVLDKKLLKQSIRDGVTVQKGQMTEEDMEKILQSVRNSNIFTSDEKKFFL